MRVLRAVGLGVLVFLAAAAFVTAVAGTANQIMPDQPRTGWRMLGGFWGLAGGLAIAARSDWQRRMTLVALLGMLALIAAGVALLW